MTFIDYQGVKEVIVLPVLSGRAPRNPGTPCQKVKLPCLGLAPVNTEDS